MPTSQRDGAADMPLPWERLLWSGRPAWSFVTRERYVLTDFRLVRQAGGHLDDLVLHDIRDVACRQSRVDSLLGTSTLTVRPRDVRRAPIVLRGVRRGPELAALLELVAGEPPASLDTPAAQAALAWNPQPAVVNLGEATSAVAVVLIAVFAVVAGLHGTGVPTLSYAADDAIYPGGHKRDRAEIVRYMREEIMPWARTALAPLVGGPDLVTCETCHGRKPAAREWRMPAVAVLPQPDLREKGWEQYGGRMDAQMRNAIYGYLAEPEKQSKAAYMREIVMPGMARLLHRPAYDFTQSYAFNRSSLAFGCYHCHLVQ